jgi:hypothetical protein
MNDDERRRERKGKLSDDPQEEAHQFAVRDIGKP